jgi:transcription termination/antitermination protein NusA
LSPAKILNVQLDMEEKEAKVGVLEDQLSLAIGKAGQNVRLAARLTGWKIDINPENIGGDSSGEEVGQGEEGTVEPETEATAVAEENAGGIGEGSVEEAQDPAKQMEESEE